MFSTNDFHQTKKLLESVSTCFYTYTPKNEKSIPILLKGLSHTQSPQEILNELKTLNIEGLSFNKVINFTTKKSLAKNIQLPIFLVQLSAVSQIHRLQKVTRLCHHVITWEKVKTSEIIQCKRCQAYRACGVQL